jgi:hypothetical protein
MSAVERVTIAWDELAAAWRIAGDPPGPAGSVSVEFGAAVWSFDWVDPARLTEVLVPVIEGGGAFEVAPTSIDSVSRMCGEDVGGSLARLAQGAAPETAVEALSPRSAELRHAAGRLSICVETDALAGPAPTWWVVEAAAAMAHIGRSSNPALAVELTDEAFEVVDALPDGLVERLQEAGLAAPLRRVLLDAGLADGDLPSRLRLDADEVDRRFDGLVAASGDPAAPLRDLLVTPAFRRASVVPSVRADERDVEWVEVPIGSLRRATWRRLPGDVIEVLVTVAGGAPSDLRVRLVDVGGRTPQVIARSVLRPSANHQGATAATARFPSVPGHAIVRVELTSSDAAPLPESLSAERHAASVSRGAVALEREAGAAARFDLDNAVRVSRVAAGQWALASRAWEAAGVGERAAICRRHEERLQDGFRQAVGGSPESTESPVATAGWAESAIAVVRSFLSDASAQLGGPRREPESSAALARVAESVDDIELAAHFRSDQARAMAAGDDRTAISLLALRHFASIATRAPRDLEHLGAGEG